MKNKKYVKHYSVFLAFVLALFLSACGGGGGAKSATGNPVIEPTNEPEIPVVPLPEITSFTASSETITQGEATLLVAAFTGGVATIDHGVGKVSSGEIKPVAPIETTTYLLTVTNSDEVQATQAITITTNNPVLPLTKIKEFPHPIQDYDGDFALLVDPAQEDSTRFDSNGQSYSKQILVTYNIETDVITVDNTYFNISYHASGNTFFAHLPDKSNNMRLEALSTDQGGDLSLITSPTTVVDDHTITSVDDHKTKTTFKTGYVISTMFGNTAFSDGNAVVYCAEILKDETYATVYNDGINEEVLSTYPNGCFMGQNGYRINNGWLSFIKRSAIWIRDPTGNLLEIKISSFNFNTVVLIALTDKGDIIFEEDNRIFLSKQGLPPVELAQIPNRLIDDIWYVFQGNSLFKVDTGD